MTAWEWMRRNQKKTLKHRGKWLAVSSSGIVGTSDDFDDVYVQARKRGVSNPLVFKVPPDDRPKIRH